MGTGGRTLLDKIWDARLVAAETGEAPAVLYVDLHLMHEVTIDIEHARAVRLAIDDVVIENLVVEGLRRSGHQALP